MTLILLNHVSQTRFSKPPALNRSLFVLRGICVPLEQARATRVRRGGLSSPRRGLSQPVSTAWVWGTWADRWSSQRRKKWGNRSRRRWASQGTQMETGLVSDSRGRRVHPIQSSFLMPVASLLCVAHKPSVAPYAFSPKSTFLKTSGVSPHPLRTP